MEFPTVRAANSLVVDQALRGPEQLRLVKKWGPERVELACERALEAEAINVNLIARMIANATEADKTEQPPEPVVIQGRFARDKEEFATTVEVAK